MVGLVTAHLRKCRARSVLVIPAVRFSWFLFVASASVWTLPVASPRESDVFYRIDHLNREISFIFLRWGMRAVEVDPRCDNCPYVWFKHPSPMNCSLFLITECADTSSIIFSLSYIRLHTTFRFPPCLLRSAGTPPYVLPPAGSSVFDHGLIGTLRYWAFTLPRSESHPCSDRCCQGTHFVRPLPW